MNELLLELRAIRRLLESVDRKLGPTASTVDSQLEQANRHANNRQASQAMWLAVPEEARRTWERLVKLDRDNLDKPSRD